MPVDTIAAISICLGLAYILVDVAGAFERPQTPTPPQLLIEAGPAGRQVARIDRDAWGRWYAAVGLPAPPDLDGSDPIPTGLILDAAAEWAAQRDPASLGTLGRLYQALEAHREAASCFAAARELDPGEPMWAYQLGVACQSLGMTGRAVAALEAALRMEPTYATTHARLGEMYLELGAWNKAERAYSDYRKLEPDLSVGYVGLGRVALGRGDTARAESHFITAVAKTPNDFRAYYFLSRAQTANGKTDAAVRSATIARRLKRYRGWLVFDERLRESHRLARTQRYLENELSKAEGRGDLPACVTFVERLVARRPDDHTMLGNLATLYRAVGRTDEAIATVRTGLERSPNDPELHCVQAEIAFGERDYSAARRSIDRALELDARSSRATSLLGRTLFIEGRHEEAIATMRSCMEMNPDSTEVLLVLAEMLRQTGDVEGAVRELSAASRADPQNRRIQALLKDLPIPGPGPEP